MIAGHLQCSVEGWRLGVGQGGLSPLTLKVGLGKNGTGGLLRAIVDHELLTVHWTPHAVVTLTIH